MNINKDNIEFKKLKVEHKEIYVLNNTKHTVNAYNKSVRHDTKSEVIERIYLNDGKRTNLFELVNEKTEIISGSEIIFVSKDDEMLAYKNKNNDIKFNNKLTNFYKENDKNNRQIIKSIQSMYIIFLSCMLLIPFVSVIVAGYFYEANKNKRKSFDFLDYNFEEKNTSLYIFYITLVSNIGYCYQLINNYNSTIITLISVGFSLFAIFSSYIHNIKFDNNIRNNLLELKDFIYTNIKY